MSGRRTTPFVLSLSLAVPLGTRSLCQRERDAGEEFPRGMRAIVGCWKCVTQAGLSCRWLTWLAILGEFGLQDGRIELRTKMSKPGRKPFLVTMAAIAFVCAAGCRSVPSRPERAVTSVAQIRKLSPQQVAAGVQAHLRGVVTYAFASDDICFIQDATGGIRIQLRRGQMVAESGKEMEVWGTVGAGGEMPMLSDPNFKLLGNAPLPAAQALGPEPDQASRLVYRRVSVTGVVQSAVDVHNDVTALELRTARTTVTVKALSPTFSDPAALVDAEIRIDGVLVTAPGVGGSDSLAVWSPSLMEVAVVSPARSPQASPLETVASLRRLARRGLPAHRVRLRGSVEAASTPGRLSIADASGRMEVVPDDPNELSQGKNGEDVREAAGFATLRGDEVVLANAVDVAVAASPPPLAVQDTARGIHQLTAAEASRRYPVRLRGVVTYADAFNGILFVQDHTDGIFVSVADANSGVLRPRDWIEVTGETTPGDFAPGVTRAHFRILGHAAVPRPDRNSIEAVFQGQRDCRWIELPGVIQSVAQGSREAVVQVLCGTHHLQARVLAPADELASLVNAELKLRGVAGALFNDRRQMLGIVIYVPGRDYIQVAQAAPRDPFDVPLRTAETLLQFSSGSAMGHRVRLLGVVTATELSGPTVVRDATDAVIVRDHNDAQLKPGDVAEVVGFPAIGQYAPVLTGALIRGTGSGMVPVPQVLSAAQLQGASHEGELVQVEGVLSDRTLHADRLLLSLKSGPVRFMAQLRSGSLARMPELGAQLRVAGICSLQVDDSREAISPRSFEIWMRSPSDLTIVKQPPWLTFERLQPIFFITLGTAGVALLWATRLRRRLDAQTSKLMQKTAQLEKEHRQTTAALHRAREAEVMEQAHKHVLELVARDEDLDSVLTRLAQAVEEHCIGALCSIQMRLPGGQRLGASPSLAPGWQQVLVDLQIEDFCGAGVHPLNGLSQAPAWQTLADPRVAGRIQRLCLAPIEWETQAVGVVIAFLGGDLVLRRSEHDFLVSASRLAALAVERHVLYDQLSYRAQHDELTGLENRAAMLARLSREIRAAASVGSLLAVIYIDLDSFKDTNDTFGHAAGDAVLREVAQRMAAGVRRSDAVARLGGDEFVVVLPGVAARSNAVRIASQLVASLSRPVLFGGHELAAGASAGVSLYPVDGEDAETLLKVADARMYQKKSYQRSNGVAEVASGMDTEAHVV